MQGDLFWGLFLIVLGVALVLRWVFSMNIPIARTIFAFILVYLGISVLAGGWNSSRDNLALFQNKDVLISQQQQEYNLVFSSAGLKTAETLSPGGNTKKINVIISSGEFIIPTGLPVMIKSSSAFARTEFPDGNAIVFGEYTYRSPEWEQNQAYLAIETNVVFGNLKILRGS